MVDICLYIDIERKFKSFVIVGCINFIMRGDLFQY